MRQFINLLADNAVGMIRFYLFPWFKTQWFSSGKTTSRLGSPFLEQIFTVWSGKWNICALLQRVERANPIGLWQAIVLAAMDDKLWRRPLVHKVDRVVLFEHLLRFPIPGTATPIMVELYAWFNRGSSEKMSDGVTQRKAHQWSSHCKSRQRRHRGTRGP